VGKCLHICGHRSAGWVLVEVLASYLLIKVGGLGWYVDVSIKIAGTSHCSCQKRAVHRVWVMGAVFHGLGQDTMLEYSRYPNGGIGLYVVECQACHCREETLG